MKAHLIANKKSGQGKGETLADEAQKICAELGAELVNYEIKDAADFEKQSKTAVQNALKDGGVVIAAGGDGTIRGVAQEAHGKNVKFAAVPCGTFNFFARTHHIPEDHLEAFRLALTGTPRPVRLGEMNGQVFLINASLGLYEKAIRERELRTSRYGRNRFVVIISTLISLLSDYLLLRVEMRRDGQKHTAKTPMIFIGNNALQLRDLSMKIAKCMNKDMLAVVMMKPMSKLETLRVLVRGIFKTLENEERLENFCVEELIIHTGKKFQPTALDGELFNMSSPLTIRALPEALNLMSPHEKPEAAP